MFGNVTTLEGLHVTGKYRDTWDLVGKVFRFGNTGTKAGSPRGSLRGSGPCCRRGCTLQSNPIVTKLSLTCLGLGVESLGLRVEALGIRVEGSGFRVLLSQAIGRGQHAHARSISIFLPCCLSPSLPFLPLHPRATTEEPHFSMGATNPHGKTKSILPSDSPRQSVRRVGFNARRI